MRFREKRMHEKTTSRGEVSYADPDLSRAILSTVIFNNFDYETIENKGFGRLPGRLRITVQPPPQLSLLVGSAPLRPDSPDG
jgi:hypothetical protein